MEELNVLEKRTIELEKKVSTLFTEPEDMMDKIIYFKNYDESHKALQYILDNKLGIEIYGSGIIRTTQRAINGLRLEGFDFETASSEKEVYEKEPTLVKDYADQVREHYQLPSWREKNKK